MLITVEIQYSGVLQESMPLFPPNDIMALYKFRIIIIQN